MILIIDHIAFATNDIKKDMKKFERWGYENKFIESQIKNPSIKKKYLKVYNEYHTLSFMESSRNVNVELINHHNINNKTSFITPVFSGEKINTVMKNLSEKKITNSSLIGYSLKEFGIDCFFEKQPSSDLFLFNKILVETPKLNESLRFWKLLGFDVVEVNDKSALLEFKSILDDVGLKIYLEKIDKEREFHLDDKGFNCVALISNSLKKEREILSEAGYELTNIDKIVVDNKCVKILLVVGPGNELVELIELEEENQLD